MAELLRSIESLLFVSDEPLTVHRIQQVLPDSPPAEIRNALADLQKEYAGRAMALEEIAGGYQLLTRPEYAPTIAAFGKSRSDRKLSAAAMETLAIIAYKQPIKRADVEAIRGVQSGEILRALMERGLVKIAGRENVPGNPLLYGTTDEFLQAFALHSVEGLPKPEEVK